MRDQEVSAGERIPGSAYFRAFCSCCGEAMRVTSERVIMTTLYCERCEGCHRIPGAGFKLTPRQAIGSVKTRS